MTRSRRPEPLSVGETRLGVDVGGTFTDLVALSEGTLITAKVPSTPQDQSEGVMNAIETSEVEPGAVIGPRPRDDRGDQRPAGAPRRQDGPRHHRGLPGRAGDSPPEPPCPLRPDPRPPTTPRPARAALHGRREDGPGRRGRPPRRGQPEGGRRRDRRGGCRGRRGVPALRVHAPRARRSGWERRYGRRCPTCTSPSAARCCRSSGSTSGSPRRPPTPTWRRGSPRTSRTWPRRPEEAGVPGPLIMQSSGGVVPDRRRHLRRRGLRALRARRGRRRRGVRRVARRLPGPPDLRHGRDVDGRGARSSRARPRRRRRRSSRACP